MTRGRVIAAVVIALLAFVAAVGIASFESCQGCVDESVARQQGGGANNISKAVKGGNDAKRVETPTPSKANEDEEPAPAKTDDQDSGPAKGGGNKVTNIPVRCVCYNTCRAAGRSSAECADQCCGFQPSATAKTVPAPTPVQPPAPVIIPTPSPVKTTNVTAACLSSVEAHGRKLGRLPTSLRVSKSGVQVDGQDVACYSHVVVFGPPESGGLVRLPLSKGQVSFGGQVDNLRRFDRFSLAKLDGDQVDYWALLTPELGQVELVFEQGAGHAVRIPGR